MGETPFYLTPKFAIAQIIFERIAHKIVWKQTMEDLLNVQELASQPRNMDGRHLASSSHMHEQLGRQGHHLMDD